MKKMCGMCLNWKVLVGLAAVGLGVWILAPNLFAAALPLLLLAACPLSMLLMMLMMQGNGMQNMQGGQCAAEPHREEVPVLTGLPPDEQLAQLKMALADTQAKQEVIALHIAELEASSRPAALRGG